MSVLDYFRRAKPSVGTGLDPRAHGGTGRGHANGFLELEELNNELRHPLGHRIYDRMYRTDGDVRQALQLAINPIISGTWQVLPVGDDEADQTARDIAADVQWALFEYMRPNLIGHLVEFLPVVMRSGFAPGEIVWAHTKRDGKDLIAPNRIELRLPRSVWRWEQDGSRLTSITQYLPAGSPGSVMAGEGEGSPAYGGAGYGLGAVKIDAQNLVYYRVGAEGDNWEGVSLLRPAYKHWYMKDIIEKVDAIAQEREAMGIPVLYPPPGASPEQLDDLEAILSAMRTNEQGYIIMPGQKAGVSGTPDGAGWLLDLIGFDRSGSGRDPQPSLKYHTEKIAAAFISEFMRLGHGGGGGGGGKGAAEAQYNPFTLSIEALTTIIEQELNDSIVAPFVAYNYPDAQDPPKLKMSLVDAQSLSTLADFVLKLTQVGALLPDLELEEFLRARADLPPSDAEVVAARGEDDEQVRRQIVGGNINPTPLDESGLNAPSVDPFGSNAPVGEHKDGKPAGQPLKRAAGRATAKPGQKASGKPNGSPGGAGAKGTGSPRGAGKTTLDALGPEGFVSLDEIEAQMDSMPGRMASVGATHVRAMAAEMASSKKPGARSKSTPGLRNAIHSNLQDAYDTGAGHVRDELAAQGVGVGVADVRLDAGARDRGRGHLAARASIAADRVELAVRSAIVGGDLAHGQTGRAQAAGERAGRAALRAAGHDHGIAALVLGRHDQAVDLAASTPLTATYTSVLDRNTCASCDDADDGVARELDDPVRLENRPPNPACESLDSGANRCRCFEVFSPAVGE